jgi:hypothetical protein
MGDTSDAVNRMSASNRDTWPGGCRGKQVESRSTEGIWDRGKVVDGAEYDRIRPRSDGNAHGVERRDLEKSVTTCGPTRPHRRVEANRADRMRQISCIWTGEGVGTISRCDMQDRATGVDRGRTART